MTSFHKVELADGHVTLYCADCLDVLPTLKEESVDAVITDPPYNGVKDDLWDNQWDTRVDYLDWLDRVVTQIKQALQFNGSLYLFTSSKIASQAEILIGERFHVLNSIVWKKPKYSTKAEMSKKSQWHKFWGSERIVFAEHYNSENINRNWLGSGNPCDKSFRFVFEPLRAYLAGELNKAGLSMEDINREWQAMRNTKGSIAAHWFTAPQWELPTPERYIWLRSVLSKKGNGKYLQRAYKDLQQEYESLQRPFNVDDDSPYTDVWEFDTVHNHLNKHPCEKPVDLLKHMVNISTRFNATVLDPFMGSGTTGEACIKTGRDFIGIEIDEHYFDIAVKRIEEALGKRSIVIQNGDGQNVTITEEQTRLL